jgi:hypothetical protein
MWYKFKLEFTDGVVEYSLASFNDPIFAIGSAILMCLNRKKEVAIITLVNA